MSSRLPPPSQEKEEFREHLQKSEWSTDNIEFTLNGPDLVARTSERKQIIEVKGSKKVAYNSIKGLLGVVNFFTSSEPTERT